MFARAWSGTVIGVEARSVAVESYRGKGLPGLTLIGLARGAVKESSVRVRSAMLASDVKLGTQRLVVNLLPAELPKEASALDLPLAVSLLASGGVVDVGALKGRRFYGELSLGGEIEAVRGGVLMADLVRRHDEREIILPLENAGEAAAIPGVRVIGARTLKEVINHLSGLVPIEPMVREPRRVSGDHGCFSEVRGQVQAKRALELAAGGGHNVLLIGPPGSGKTMLARRLPGILPMLEAEESIEVTRIHSAAGLLKDGGLVHERPFRAPHHTASEPALCGGGSIPRPGEVTLAHRGVLFLDELPEFSRRSLESLREPLEDGSIHIARSAMSFRFPAVVLLVAAMNPCPCGKYSGDERQQKKSEEISSSGPCMCSFDQVLRYRSRISGPLLDRIDLHVTVDAVPYRDFMLDGSGDTSEVIRERVSSARERQVSRQGQLGWNSLLSQRQLRELVPVDAAMLALIERGMTEFGLSTRSINRILKVSRTIADLEGAQRVESRHVEEAMGLRLLGRGGLPV